MCLCMSMYAYMHVYMSVYGYFDVCFCILVDTRSPPTSRQSEEGAVAALCPSYAAAAAAIAGSCWVDGGGPALTAYASEVHPDLSTCTGHVAVRV